MTWIIAALVVAVALSVAYKRGFRRGVRVVRRQQEWRRFRRVQ